MQLKDNLISKTYVYNQIFKYEGALYAFVTIQHWRLAVDHWRPMPIKMGYKLKLPVFCLT